GEGGVGAPGSSGVGLNTLSTTLDFQQGEMQQTGNSLDLALNGDGLFVERDDTGALRYTRAGQFDFNADGILVDRTDGAHVMALDDTGRLTEVTLANLRSNAATASSTLQFQGNLSSDGSTDTIDSVTVFDAVGGQHTLKLAFANGAPATPGSWTVTVTDGATTVGTGTINFINGSPDPAASKITLTY